MSAPRGPLFLGSLGCALLVLSAWLLVPRRAGNARELPALRVCLVDCSASAVRLRDSWLPWVRAELRREALEAREHGQELAEISFAQGVSLGFPPGPPDGFLAHLEGREAPPFDPRRSAGGDGATRLAAALEAAAAALLVPGRGPGELVLLGEGTFTGENPSAALARLAQAGVRVRCIPLPPASHADLALLELRAPARIEAGAPLIATARLSFRRAAGGESAHLSVEVENASATSSFELPISLPFHDGEFELPIDCGSAGLGRTEVRSSARLDALADVIAENDRASAVTLAGGERILGVVAHPGELDDARAWIAPAGRSALAGLELVFLTPDDLARELARLDALVTFDLALDELPGALLSSFVERGGGWLALSGWRFLRDWIPGEPGGALHRLLPAAPAAPEQGPRDVCLLIDGSGSMAGEPFETVRTAALDLVASALPGDRVSLRFFTARLEPEHVLKERSETRAQDAEAARAAARELLGLRVPEGTTFLLRSLEEFARLAGERETLALLLTDGRERDALPDPGAEAERLARLLQGTRTRLVVIAVGDADLALLARLAGHVEGVLRGETLQDLRAIFQRELLGAQVVEGAELPVRAAARASGSLAAAVLGSAQDPLLPPLTRHVRDELRPGAEVLWQSENGEPLLALQRAGLGRVALFASLPLRGWASAWTGRAGLGEPREFESLLRWLARGPDRSGADLAARVEGETLVVTGFEEGAGARIGATLLDEGARAPRELRRLELAPPADLGKNPFTTREARLPSGLELHSLEPVVVLEVPEGSAVGPGGGLALALDPGLPEEFAQRENRVEALFFEASRGREAVPGRGQARSHPAGPWTLFLGLLLLFASGAFGRGASGGGQGAARNGR